MSTAPVSPHNACPDAAAPRRPARARVADRPVLRRVLALLVVLATGAVLALATWLEPSSAGLGTHQQLNMPACGWIALMDLPCPTCGMTTSFAFAADGNFIAGFAAQPLGLLLAILTAGAFLVASYVAITGSRIGGVFPRLWGRHTGWWISGVVLVAWGYKVISYKELMPW